MARPRCHMIGRMLGRGGKDGARALVIFHRLAAEHKGDRHAIAAELGISPTTVWRWCKAHEIDLDAIALGALE